MLFFTYGGSFNRATGVGLASGFGLQQLIAALPAASQDAARVGLVMGVTGQSDLSALSAEQIDGLVLNANFGPVAELVFEGALAELGLRIVTLPSGRRGYQTADGVVKETLEEASRVSGGGKCEKLDMDTGLK